MLRSRPRWTRIPGLVLVLAALLVMLPARKGAAQRATGEVALAYIYQDSVTLAGKDGLPIETTGPTFAYGQGARLLWTADGRTLYIARDDGLYVTGADGGAAVKMPGAYGRTLTLSQDQQVMYYLETASPQEVDNPNDPDTSLISFPFREVNMLLMDGGFGRLSGYFGRYNAASARVDLTFAAALYVREGGLLGPGRPNLWPTYGANVFGTCCFPEPGLGLFNATTGDQILDYDPEFIPGAAAANGTGTHLAGPTTTGMIRVVDMITGGVRDYDIQIAGGLGTIERVTWSPDDTRLYFISRYAPQNPLNLTAEPPFPVDASSALIRLYRLNLVTSAISELAWRADVYGVSSLAATDRYVFATVVDSNIGLINAINTGQVPPNMFATDPALTRYMPQTHLWRVEVEGNTADDVLNNVWGVTARPIR